ncbi:Amiloride-sensitive sodium channel subunit beta-2 [Nymphon striatum]|nr:Amiloride-sensitive sodium channel subunit beta-2 [Nymphon striatum]
MNNLRPTWNNFANETSIHGVERIASENVLRRLTWLLLVLMAIGASFYQWYIIVSSYLAGETYSSFSIEKNKYLELPSVTICQKDLKFKPSHYSDFENLQKLAQNVSNLTEFECSEQLQNESTFINTSKKYHPVVTESNLGRFFDFYSIKEYFTKTYYKMVPCITMNATNLPTKYRTTLGHGQEFGYSITVQTQQNNDDISGIEVFIHDANNGMVEDGFKIQSGDHALISVQLNKSIINPYVFTYLNISDSNDHQPCLSCENLDYIYRNGFKTQNDDTEYTNEASVTIFFKTLDIFVKNERYVNELTGVIANIGGIGGLYLGFSLMTIAELIEFLLNLWWVLITKKNDTNESS